EGERWLEAAESWAQRIDHGSVKKVIPELLQARSAGPAIVDEAVERNADLIVMALRNQRKHGRPTVGETIPYVLKNAPCEVLISRLPPQSGFDRCNWGPELEVSP